MLEQSVVERFPLAGVHAADLFRGISRATEMRTGSSITFRTIPRERQSIRRFSPNSNGSRPGAEERAASPPLRSPASQGPRAPGSADTAGWAATAVALEAAALGSRRSSVPRNRSQPIRSPPIRSPWPTRSPPIRSRLGPRPTCRRRNLVRAGPHERRKRLLESRRDHRRVRPGDRHARGADAETTWEVLATGITADTLVGETSRSLVAKRNCPPNSGCRWALSKATRPTSPSRSIKHGPAVVQSKSS